MNKDEKIDYLNTIVKYLNLSAVCDLYNQQNKTNKIDYNNMRVVLKRQSISRLSEDKLDAFIEFLHSFLIDVVFEHESVSIDQKKREIKKHLNDEAHKFTNLIMEVVDNEL